MPRLSHSEYDRLLDFIAELQQPVTGREFGGRLVELAGALVPGSMVTVDQIHEPTGSYLLDHNCPLTGAESDHFFGRLQEVYQQNPIYGYLQSGGEGPVVRMTDLCTRAELHGTDFYHDIFRPLEVEHQISVVMPREGWITTLTINRDRDFAEPVSDLLLLASRHIILAHRTAQLLGEMRPEEAADTRLTRREREVFHWMREGKRNGEIALILGCSVRTVEKHVENILRKTASETRGAAVHSDRRG